MKEIRFTQEDVAELAGKLSNLRDGLTESDRVLLLAIFAAAGELARSSDQAGEGTLPLFDVPGQQPRKRVETRAEPEILNDLRQQLLTAYIPEKSLGSASQGHDVFSIHDIGVNPPPHVGGSGTGGSDPSAGGGGGS